MAKKSCNPRISGMYRHSVSASIALAVRVLQGLGTELALATADSLLGNSHAALLDREIDPSSYSDVGLFRDDYLALSLMSKYPYLDVKIDREKVALDAFIKSEQQCRSANTRLGSEVYSIRSLYTPHSIFHLARLKISSLLGPFSWDLAEHHFGFGPGSTTSLPKRCGDSYFKFGAIKPHVTKGCSVLALCAVKRIPRWYSYLLEVSGQDPVAFETLPIPDQVEALFTIVPGNRVTTVPKSAKTDRVIAIEPDLNMYIQKGIGGLIRSRLLRVSVDLNNQSINQDLAHEGSITGNLCTLDLSSASDTVSMKLVEELLPYDWVEAIKLCRSPFGTLPDGTLIEYQKVSSMGNGFTFELESLIFWAIVKSVITLFRPEESRLAVYGDDLIFSSSIFSTVCWMLDYCGFTPNKKKSFNSGPFRESCGKHFFKGVDVTPLYIRDDIKTPDRLIWFSNSIRRWSRFTYGLDGRLYKAYSYSVSLLPKCLQKPSIPDGFGDIALIGDFDEARPSWSKRLQCFVGIGVSDVRETFVPGEIPYLLRSLSSLERLSSSNLSGPSSGIIKNHHKRRWKVIHLPVTRWESYGPWYGP